MASKGNTKKAAEEFLKTGAAPELNLDNDQDPENLDEQLDELAAEQEETEEATEETQEEEVEQDETPEEKPGKKTEKKPAKKEEQATEDDSEEEESEEDADGNVADEDPDALPEEVAALPRVQALVQAEEQLNTIKDALVEGYGIDTTDFGKAVNQLRLERSDAHMLYQIIDQTLPASSFLSNLEKGFDQKKVVEPIFLSIADHLGRNGFLEAYIDHRGFKLVPKDQAGNTGAQAGSLGTAVTNASKVSPEMQKVMDQLTNLQQQISGGGANRQPGQLSAQDQQHETTFENEVKRLMKEKNVDPKFFGDFKTAIVQMVNQYPGGSKAIKDRIAKGNFVDVRRFFTTHNNAQLERAKQYMKTASTGKKVVVKKPGTPNAAPTTQKPGSKKAPAPLSKDQRKAKLLQALTGKQ